jgi:hypothetical protein
MDESAVFWAFCRGIADRREVLAANFCRARQNGAAAG